jgi:ribosomal protein S18 acetylase RimI-like enzyme
MNAATLISVQPSIRRLPFHPGAVEDVVAFALAHPLKPSHPPRQLRRFLGQLISDPRLVIDIHDDRQRIASAVLLDKVQNPSNSACLVIMGLDRDAAAATVYDLMIGEAKTELPASKSGIELDFCDDCPVDLRFFEDCGFRPFYTTFEMLKGNRGYPPAILPEGYGWRNLTLADLREYHQALILVFAENLEMNVTSLEETEANLASRRIPGTLLLHCNRIVGFLNVFIDDEDGVSGEIGTIGLLPAYRGRGLGRSLLAKAIEELAGRSVRNFKLTVAAGNETALGLYKQSGFEICRRDLCLRYSSQV